MFAIVLAALNFYFTVDDFNASVFRFHFECKLCPKIDNLGPSRFDNETACSGRDVRS